MLGQLILRSAHKSLVTNTERRKMFRRLKVGTWSRAPAFLRVEMARAQISDFEIDSFCLIGRMS